MQAIHRQASSSSLATYSATTTPAHSPQQTFLEDRLNALLANFDNGTHAFCREDRTSADGYAMAAKLTKATAAAAAQQKAYQAQQQTQQENRRPSLISMLSLSRPSGQQHFDPSREPKLHGLP